MTTKPKRSQKTQSRSPAKTAGRRSTAPKTTTEPKRTKLARLIETLDRSGGATIAELMKATGWQAHSVRGALAGALRKKGHIICSEKIDGVRHYRLEGPAS